MTTKAEFYLGLSTVLPGLSTRVALSRPHHHPGPPCKLNAGRVGSRSPDTSAKLANHLVQHLHLFIGDAGLGDLDELEHGARIHDREEEGGIAWLVFSIEGVEAGLF